MIQWCKKHASACVSLVLLAALAVFGVTYHKQIWLVLTQPAARDAFVAYVRGTGVTGFLAFLGLQVLQVVVAVLPGEPVEIMAGALYGIDHIPTRWLERLDPNIRTQCTQQARALYQLAQQGHTP